MLISACFYFDFYLETERSEAVLYNKKTIETPKPVMPVGNNISHMFAALTHVMQHFILKMNLAWM